jgi:hypothetical protein
MFRCWDSHYLSSPEKHPLAVDLHTVMIPRSFVSRIEQQGLDMAISPLDDLIQSIVVKGPILLRKCRGDYGGTRQQVTKRLSQLHYSCPHNEC